MKITVILKTSIRYDGVKMGIEIYKIPVSLDSNTGSRYNTFISYGRLQICFDNFSGADGQFCQQLSVKKEINSQPFGNAEYPVSDLQVTADAEHPSVRW
jgi:hypothetical protein